MRQPKTASAAIAGSGETPIVANMGSPPPIAGNAGETPPPAAALLIGGKAVPEARRHELTRLLIQTLGDLGFDDAARSVQAQSGLHAQSSGAQRFRAYLLDGDWEQVERLLPTLGHLKHSSVTLIRFMVREQKYLELLEAGDVAGALGVLRTELAGLNCNTPRLHLLASLVMFSDTASLKRKVDWDGRDGESRARLLTRIQHFIPAAVMMPEHRLFALLEQAVGFQRARCVYHNCADDDASSLFTDHMCDTSNFPTTTHKVLKEHRDEVYHIAFSHDGHYLASASKDGRAIVYNVLNHFKVHFVLDAHEDPVSYVCWSPDDSLLLTCSNDHYVRLWSMADGTLRRTYRQHTDSVTCCAWLPDNARFVSGGLDKNILLHSVDGAALHRWAGARATDIAVTSDGKKLLVVSNEDKLRVYDLASAEKALLFSIRSEFAVTSVTLSSDNRHILLNLVHKELHMYSMETQKLEACFKERQQGRFVIRSCFGGRNHNFVASGSEDQKVYIWHMAHPDAPLQTLSGHTATVNAVAWNSADPQMLASCADDNTVRMYFF